MAGLVVLWARGRRVLLAAPIPDRAVLALPLVTSLAVREWIVVDGDDELTIADHTFRIVGWSASSTPGLVVEHTCDPCAST